MTHRYRGRNTPGTNAADEGITTEYTQNEGTLRSVSSRIKTAEQAMKAAEVDTAEWFAEKVIIKKWEVLRRDDKEPVQMFGVTVHLRRRVAKAAVDAVEMLCGRIASLSKRAPAKKYKPNGERFMLEFSPFDTHFGKLCWARETGDDYDLAIAERLFADALEEILSYVPHLKGIERFVFPVGNDLFHTDTIDDTTTAGTPQDTDGRWAKMWATGQAACVRAINRMTQIAPVDVLWVPGNHDWKTSFHLAANLDAWYRNDENVAVDLNPSPRKYLKYGATLLGFTHGHEEKHQSLPTIMATERPDLWAATLFHEWHIAHQHRKRKLDFMSVDSHDGVVVRTLPSISGSDGWHHKKGYIGNRAAEAYLWSFERGYAGHFSANVRTG